MGDNRVTSRPGLLIIVLLLSTLACEAGRGVDIASPEDPGTATNVCTVPRDQFADGGVGKDGIPALTDPLLVGSTEVSYLADSDRVLGLLVDGVPVAVPHNILWWHEIANFNFPSAQLAVTYCPLTGSGMVFDRSVIRGGEFGVSGLLFQNNLTLYDRTTSESLWPQMGRQAACGSRLGASLTMVPAIEMTWEGWTTRHPDTRVVSDDTGYNRRYTADNYPYGNYEDPEDDGLLFPMEIDRRRLPKERLLGIPDSRRGGIAVPFLELDDGAAVNVVHASTGEQSVVVFWNARYQSAMAYRPRLGSDVLTFEVRDEQIIDTATQSVWNVEGRAVSGPLAGENLEPIAEAYVAFWFAWAAFHPETRIWEAP